MQTKTKRNLILLIIVAAVLWWYWPAIASRAASRPQQIDYAPQPAAQPAPQQPSTWSVDPDSITPYMVIPANPAEIPYTVPAGSPIVHGMPTVKEPIPDPARLEMLENVVSVSGVAQPKDWTDEITAVNRNMQNAIQIVEACAMEKITAVTETPPRLVDCSMTVENLERAKELVGELEEAIREGQQ